MKRYGLSKDEKLVSFRDAASLFESGKSIHRHPVRIVWKEFPRSGQLPALVLFSVSKRKFPHAVDRNRIKRLLREAYRFMKQDFFDKIPDTLTLHLGIIFTGHELPDLADIQNQLSHTLDRLILQLRKTV